MVSSHWIRWLTQTTQENPKTPNPKAQPILPPLWVNIIVSLLMHILSYCWLMFVSYFLNIMCEFAKVYFFYISQKLIYSWYVILLISYFWYNFACQIKFIRGRNYFGSIRKYCCKCWFCFSKWLISINYLW